MKAVCLLVLSPLFLWVQYVSPQEAHHQVLEEKAYNQFAVELFSETSSFLNMQRNIILSPFSVWSVLALLTEGSSGNTQTQLKAALHLNMGKKNLGHRYQAINNLFKASKNSSVELKSANALVTDKNRPVCANYETIVEKLFNTQVIPINFLDVQDSLREINSWVSNNTCHRISQIINEGDLKEPHLILANAVYFKGTWKHPFNESDTVDEDFLNEAGQVIGKVSTMKQSSPFAYGYVPEVEAHMLVLPYEGETFSMVVAMPQKKVSLLQMLERIKLVSLGEVLKQLDQMQSEGIEEVRVQLPRFTIQSDLIINSPLAKLGIVDAFSRLANFSSITSADVYVSKIIHKTEIEVNERGTVASAATGVVFMDKMMPSVFRVNRPFICFIIENKRKLVLFVGRVSNPKSKMK